MLKKIILQITVSFIIFISCSQKSKKTEITIETNIEKINFNSQKKDKVFNGDITLTTQKEIDDFGKNNYTFIDGNINSIDFSKKIFNVDALKTIKSINGEFLMTRINTIESINGLTNLERVNGDFTISGCGNKLKKIGDFNKLTVINGDVTFGNNQGEYGQNGVSEISGFNDIKKLNNIYISGNPGLKILNCFKNVQEIKSIYISNVNVEGISNFENTDKL